MIKSALLIALFLLPAMLLAASRATGAERSSLVSVELSSAAEVIYAAIQQRTPITFRYKGEIRIVHPHRIGRSKTGNILLRAWEVQRAGESVGQWRMYTLDKMENIYPITDKNFEIAPNYKSPDKLIPDVFFELPIHDERAAE
ncbi:MAG: WYL domain-containing protein [Kiritimatiellae bacterium]|nr:WYL domain-containing protein [Kiritimatiellia bacterium]